MRRRCVLWPRRVIYRTMFFRLAICWLLAVTRPPLCSSNQSHVHVYLFTEGTRVNLCFFLLCSSGWLWIELDSFNWGSEYNSFVWNMFNTSANPKQISEQYICTVYENPAYKYIYFCYKDVRPHRTIPSHLIKRMHIKYVYYIMYLYVSTLPSVCYFSCTRVTFIFPVRLPLSLCGQPVLCWWYVRLVRLPSSWDPQTPLRNIAVTRRNQPIINFVVEQNGIYGMFDVRVL